MIYTLTISPAIDYVMHVDELIPGATNRSQQEEYYFGGIGINVSVILQNLGLPSKALGFTAGFTGKALEEGLHEQGVDTDFIHLKDGITRINVKLKAGLETEINGQGARPTDEDLRLLEERFEKMGEGDMIIISGSIPKGLPEDTYEKLLTIAVSRGATPVVDTNGQLLVNTLKHKPFLIKPNHDELKDLFGEDITPIEGARKLQEMGARNVIISLGKEGAVMLSEDGGEYSCGIAKGKVLNTVGSGDSMVAGFIAGYEQSHDYQHALNMGGAAGSATAFTPGLASREMIESCLAQLEEKK